MSSIGRASVLIGAGTIASRVSGVLRDASAHLRGADIAAASASAPADHSGRRWRARDLTDADLRGALLIATAMMAASWNGFPKATWRVRHEGLKPLL